jgi:hypothetical protein
MLLASDEPMVAFKNPIPPVLFAIADNVVFAFLAFKIFA